MAVKPVGLRKKYDDLRSGADENEKYRFSQWSGLLVKRKPNENDHPYRPPGDTAKCCVCKKYLSRGEFYKDKSRYNGLSSRCKQCEQSGLQARLLRSDNERRNLRLKKKDDGFHWCYVCRRYLFHDQFWPDSSRYNKVSSRCKDCNSMLNSKRYRAKKHRVTANPNAFPP